MDIQNQGKYTGLVSTVESRTMLNTGKVERPKFFAKRMALIGTQGLIAGCFSTKRLKINITYYLIIDKAAKSQTIISNELGPGNTLFLP